MNSPEKNQQEPTTSEMIAEEFDRMSAEETPDEEVAVSEENDPEVDETTSEEEEAPVEETEETEQVKEEIQDAADSDYKEPAPERWPDEIKEAYNSLPPEGRKAMLEGIYKPMQRQYTQATQELAEQRRLLNPVLELMQQHKNALGDNPIEGLRNQILWVEHFGKVGPEQGIADFRKAHGLDESGQEQEYMTPAERKLQDQLKSLQQIVQSQQQETAADREARQKQEQTQKLGQIQNEMISFANEQNDGKPAHPHLQRVAPAMSGLMRGGLVKSVDEYGQPIPIRDQLSAAYEQACYLDPTIRNTQQPAGRQVARVKAAQKVTSTTSRPSKPIIDDNTPIHDYIGNLYDKMEKKVG